jgi:hypothetical protein
MSSIYFLGNTTSYISIPNAAALNFETQDFTVEWFQYQTDMNSFPRIFQKGTYTANTVSIGVSIEGGSFYYWRNNSPYLVASLTSSQYKNKWVHFAICRTGGTTTFYMNGVSFGTPLADTHNYSNTENLLIANESTLTPSAAFGGYMYYFHYIKGVAKYTADFTVSTSMVSNTGNTVLLLTATGDSGSLGSTITSTAGTFAIVPTFSSPPPPPTAVPSWFLPVMFGNRALFTDNNRFYYKPNSLASGGVGGVRNYRKKGRRT